MSKVEHYKQSTPLSWRRLKKIKKKKMEGNEEFKAASKKGTGSHQFSPIVIYQKKFFSVTRFPPHKCTCGLLFTLAVNKGYHSL